MTTAQESIALDQTAFQSVLGQDGACDLLARAVVADRVPHAYLFVGMAGIGKKTTAKQWAKILQCQNQSSPLSACESCAACQKIEAGSHPDVLWINYDFQARLLREAPEKQKSLKIDTLREMERQLRLKPMEAEKKIAFLSPAEKLVGAAAHALLKILEEPPPHTHLVLIAADASQLLGTIRSRCQWIRFRPLPVKTIQTLLQKKEAQGSADDLQLAAVQSEGSLTRALDIVETTEELAFDWAGAPLSELLAWCEQFQSPKLGRDAAEDFLRRLLAEFRAALVTQERSPEEVAQVLDALHQIKQYVNPTLVLQVLLLKFRRSRRHVVK